MTNSLNNWMAVKNNANRRQLAIFSQFKLENQDIRLRPADSRPSLTDSIIEYDIVHGNKTGKFYFTDIISLDTEWNNLNPQHQVIIRAYVDSNVSEEDSIDTSSAPTW